jgi:uncharacterized protein (TIGR03067 family)
MSCSPIRQRLLFAVLSVGACFVAAAAHAADADGRSAELDGTWKLLSIELEGEERPLGEDVRWVIKQDKVFYGGEPLAALACYPASTPKGIDLAFQEPKKEHEGVYVVHGDRLKVCLNMRTSGTKERPSDFPTKDKPNLRVFTFQRVSPADEGPGPQKGFVGIALSLENNGQDVGVQMVLENSPAEKAGLRAGDLILSIGDENVRDLQSTVDAVRRKMPGSELRIRVRREGKEREIAVKVAIFPFSLLGLLD